MGAGATGERSAPFESIEAALVAGATSTSPPGCFFECLLLTSCLLLLLRRLDAARTQSTSKSVGQSDTQPDSRRDRQRAYGSERAKVMGV